MRVYMKTLAIGLLLLLISTNFLAFSSTAGSRFKDPNSRSSSDPATISAGGPYGTSSSPYHEGDVIEFEAEIIDGDVNDYFFRWDVNNDGTWEKDDFGIQKGSPIHTHAYPDDYAGLAKVEAWDGQTYKPLQKDGTVFADSLLTDLKPVGSGVYKTIGMKFTAHSEITIDELGIFNDPVKSYLLIFNMRIWTESGTLITSINNPFATTGTWTWIDIVPVTLSSGENYIISLGVGANNVPTLENPNATSDGVIETLEFVLLDTGPFGFPEVPYSTDILPAIDMHYLYNVPIPDIKEDYAQVHVVNVPPIAEAGADMEMQLGDTAHFAGGFFDPGLGDSHLIEWDFGDGFGQQGTLNPQHTYSNFGTYTVTIKVTDDDGGVGTDTLTVTVLEPLTVEDLLENLKDLIIDMDLQGGMEKSMTSTLSNALDSYERGNENAAENKINAFVNHVKAQMGKKISNDDAGLLLDLAQEIMDKIP